MLDAFLSSLKCYCITYGRGTKDAQRMRIMYALLAYVVGPAAGAAQIYRL